MWAHEQGFWNRIVARKYVPGTKFNELLVANAHEFRLWESTVQSDQNTAQLTILANNMGRGNGGGRSSYQSPALPSSTPAASTSAASFTPTH